MSNDDDYQKYRGKCKELSEQAVAGDPSLTLVRGWYYDPLWGEQMHWWTKRQDGTTYDPTARQFPSKGLGEYVEFAGYYECAECGEKVAERDMVAIGSYVCCSYTCARSLVGV